MVIGVALLAALGTGLVGFLQSHASPAATAAPAPVPAPAATFPRLASDEQVATVDGIAIPMRELQIFLDKERAATLARYPSSPATGDGERFWSRPVNGVSPADYLMRAALADVATTTVQLQLAAKYQLITDPGYGAFLAAFHAENERRAQAVAKHQVVYGPVKYTEANYLEYLIAQHAYDLEPRLEADGTLPVTHDAQNADAEYQQLIRGLASHAQLVAEGTRVVTTGGCLTTGACTR